ncbi:unnamed protein product, partial [Mesorhabditis spiculigera]
MPPVRLDALERLPLKYIFHPNRPPAVGASWVWTCPWEDDGPPDDAPAPTREQQDFIDSHTFYERAFRYLMYWRLHEKQIVLQLLIEELLESTEKYSKRIPDYPFFVMGNGDHIGALLVLWSPESLREDADVPLLIGHQFEPVHIRCISITYFMKRPRGWRERALQSSKTGKPDCFTGIMMVKFSELRVLLEIMLARLKIIVKDGEPVLGEINWQNQSVTEKSEYDKEMMTKIKEFWRTRKIDKVTDIKAKELKSRIRDWNQKQKSEAQN